MSQQSVRQAVRQSAPGARAVRRRGPAVHERRLECWRSRWGVHWASAAVRDAERPAG
jgi:hypothetical protein